MEKYPNLAGVAHRDAVEQVRAGSYSADYINWALTMQLLRDNAPGWLPELVESSAGGYVHPASGVGGFLVIRFRHIDGAKTPGVPQAIMDNRNQAVPLDKITARDITDTHRRGVCMAAALTFGLAYELWAKIPLESGYVSSQAAPNTSPVSQPGPPDSSDGLASVIARLKELDPVTQWAAILEDDAKKTYKEPGGLVALTSEQREHMAGRLKAHADKLEAAIAANGSAGESPQTGTDGSPDNKEASGAPAESPFKPPTGERGSKAKAA